MDNKLQIVLDKALLKSTNRSISETYKVSCSMKKIFNAMSPEDTDDEIVSVIKRLTI